MEAGGREEGSGGVGRGRDCAPQGLKATEQKLVWMSSLSCAPITSPTRPHAAPPTKRQVHLRPERGAAAEPLTHLTCGLHALGPAIRGWHLPHAVQHGVHPCHWSPIVLTRNSGPCLRPHNRPEAGPAWGPGAIVLTGDGHAAMWPVSALVSRELRAWLGAQKGE